MKRSSRIVTEAMQAYSFSRRAWLLGTAGERAAELHGSGFMATEVAAQVPLVMRDS
mgnify:CR=1 FL=1